MAAPLGNQYARRKGVWTSALKRALAKHGDANWRRGLDKLADKMVAAADESDLAALFHIADRLEGKATEHVQVESTVNVQVGNGRSLSNTLRALEQPSETAGPTVQ